MVAELYDFFIEYHRRTYGAEGAPIHDAVAVAQVSGPGSWRRCHRHVDVDCESSLCRGRTVVDLWHRTGESRTRTSAWASTRTASSSSSASASARSSRAPTGEEERPAGPRNRPEHGAEEASVSGSPEVPCPRAQEEARAAAARARKPRSARPRPPRRRPLPRGRHLAGGERRASSARRSPTGSTRSSGRRASASRSSSSCSARS